MIIVKLIGGLGNQMFQYALGRSLSLRSQSGLSLDIGGYSDQEGITPRSYGLGVFCINAKIASSDEIGESLYANRLSRFAGIKSSRYFREQVSNVFDSNVLNIGDGHYFEGYWQTEKYFTDIRDVLIDDFALKSEFDHLDASLLESMRLANSVSLHVRRGDYVSNPGTNQYHGTCSVEYYRRAVEYITDKVVDPVFFVFSDDIAWVKENINVDFPVTYVSNGTLKDYEELTLMSRCKYNIIANSSFSWWGAWLNQNPAKIVIAPKHWFNDLKAAKNDIIPDSWIRI